MKYQFCIRFENTTVNSAATKAIADCNKLFLGEGYVDYTFSVWDNSRKWRYYLQLVRELSVFFSAIKSKSIVGIQYPLLSINNFFTLFIKLAKLKSIRFFCIVHDVESLRTGGNNDQFIKKEIENLNAFSCIIVHNKQMLQWLRLHGLHTNAIVLTLFDYLIADGGIKDRPFSKRVVFAGNLNKSTFIYELNQIDGWQFQVYGPNFIGNKHLQNGGLKWCGEYGPEQIVQELDGSFGLIWDGSSIDKCDDTLGYYLQYNNPHKFSLYLAAGLPVIAPAHSAIATFIKEHHIGLLVDSLFDLQHLDVSNADYQIMKANVATLRGQIIKGDFFKTAIRVAEEQLLNNMQGE